MPRGGRRRGAGAPKGNFNGLKGGKYSPRLMMVYLAFLEYPDRQQLALDLSNAGFYPPPNYEYNGDRRGLVRFLYKKFFDSPEAAQSGAINPDQTLSLLHGLLDSGTTEKSAGVTRQEKNAKRQTSIRR